MIHRDFSNDHCCWQQQKKTKLLFYPGENYNIVPNDWGAGYRNNLRVKNAQQPVERLTLHNWMRKAMSTSWCSLLLEDNHGYMLFLSQRHFHEKKKLCIIVYFLGQILNTCIHVFDPRVLVYWNEC